MRRESVLVVDDDPRARSQCQAALEAARYTVVAVADGPQAERALAADPRLRERCVLAVLDYVLPADSGFHVFRALRQQRPDLAGILLTGQTSLNVAVEALNYGFSQVLAKPVDTIALCEAVAAALKERRTRQENARLHALTRLYDALGELAGVHDLLELYRCIVRLAVEETSADTASLMLLDERDHKLHVAAASGIAEQVWRDASRSYGEPISGWVLRSGVALELTPDHPVPSVVRSALRRPEVTAALCLPLVYNDRPVGVLNISRLHSQLTFAPGDVEIASVLANDAALTIQRLSLLGEQAHRERIATVGRLASTIIHDLRGPVTIIRGAAELLEDEYPAQVPVLHRIGRQVAELDRMCDQLLSFARDASNVAFERFSLHDLLHDVSHAAETSCQEAGLVWDCVLESDGEVEAARAELTRALTHLVHSAAANAPAGTQLSATGRLADGQVEFRLAGEDELPQRWQPELDAPSALAAGGAELSIALARHVVERHCGALEVSTAAATYALTLRWPQRQAA